MNNLNLIVNDDGEIHIWNGTMGSVMVSYEDTKTLRSFTSIDDAVNGLWLTGHKKAARELSRQTRTMPCKAL
jgi:hypothetical protein